MSLLLRIDMPAWREALARAFQAQPGIVPVIKGNGYGFTNELLAREAQQLGASTIAVGEASEVPAVRAGGFTGTVIVLSPLTADQLAVLDDPQVIPTVADFERLSAISQRDPHRPVIIEVITSMHRFGFVPADYAQLAALLPPERIFGVAMHMPLKGAGYLAEIERRFAQLPAKLRTALWVSHISMADYAQLQADISVPCYYRAGTHLWLAQPKPYHARAQVLAIHEVAFGEKVGYWQWRMPRAGKIAVISAGTSHGIGLQSPNSGANLRRRMASLRDGVLGAISHHRSPFSFTKDGHTWRFMFADVPHMQHSLVLVPRDVPLKVGDEVDAVVRMTTALFDAVIEQ